MTPKSFRCTGTGSKGDFTVELNKKNRAMFRPFYYALSLCSASQRIWDLTLANQKGLILYAILVLKANTLLYK